MCVLRDHNEVPLMAVFWSDSTNKDKEALPSRRVTVPGKSWGDRTKETTPPKKGQCNGEYILIVSFKGTNMQFTKLLQTSLAQNATVNGRKSDDLRTLMVSDKDVGIFIILFQRNMNYKSTTIVRRLYEVSYSLWRHLQILLFFAMLTRCRKVRLEGKESKK